MENQVMHIETVTAYIEAHLDRKLELETAGTAVYYSKYHLHMMFTHTVSMTIYDYALFMLFCFIGKSLVTVQVYIK